MQLNFSLKQPVQDLISNKKYVLQLLVITLIFIFLRVFGINIKGLSFLASIILGGYLSLLGYNIINNREKVLENIFYTQEPNKNYLFVGLKSTLIAFIYSLILAIPGVFIVLKFHLTPMLASIITSLILLPVTIYAMLLPSTVFSSTLNFQDGFNFKKAFVSIKYAWKDYLACFFISFIISEGLYIACFTAFHLIAFAVVHGFDFQLLVTKVMSLNLSSFSFKIRLNEGLVSFGGVTLSYYTTHIVSQTYKYSLTKMTTTI